MPSRANHTPITGTPVIRTAMNTALGELDAAIGGFGVLGAVFGTSVASGTHGGQLSATTWHSRDVSGLEVDSSALVTISTTNFTPIAGKYVLFAKSVVWTAAGTLNRIRLYNVTQTSVVYAGVCMFTDDDSGVATLMVPLTANGTDAYRIDHYSSAAYAFNQALGIAMSLGTNENYCTVSLIKIGSS